MHRFFFSRLRAGFALAAAAALVLAAGACATPSAEKSAAGGTAESRAKDRGAGDEKAKGRKLPWWRLSQYSREADKKMPWELDGWRQGPGLLSKDPDGFVIYRQGEAGGSSDSSKPTKVKR